SLVRAGKDLTAVTETLGVVADLHINPRRLPVYLVVEPGFEIDALGWDWSAEVPPLFVITATVRDGVTWPMARRVRQEWRLTGVYVPVAAVLKGLSRFDLTAGLDEEPSPQILVESLNVIGDIGESARFVTLPDDSTVASVRSLAPRQASLFEV